MPTDVLQITYRADLQVLVARWMRQPSTDELQNGYEHLLNVAVEYKCHTWLIDAGRRADSNKDRTTWMVQHFFPRLAERLPGNVHLAFLFTPGHLRDIETDPQLPPLSFFGNRPYQVARFTEEQAAMAWLAEHRQPQTSKQVPV
ncbi:hypothetical protein [Hymenobacter koreensis]|uniref:hypothetical protein n=1 Tax=Hymenobacter koreensis TaxID=1084523 RepID=UPI0031EA41C6